MSRFWLRYQVAIPAFPAILTARPLKLSDGAGVREACGGHTDTRYGVMIGVAGFIQDPKHLTKNPSLRIVKRETDGRPGGGRPRRVGSARDPCDQL